MKPRKLILASASPRRKRLLKALGLKFKVIKNNLNEESLLKKYKNTSPTKLVKILSLSKAVSALNKKLSYFKGDEIIAAFDTVVFCKNIIVSKPKNKKDALNKILFLSGKEHKVITGIALIDLKKKIVYLDHEVTKVRFKKITKEEAIKYVETGEPLDKAGAYAIQGIGKKLIKSISGDYFNVVGLPISKFLSILKTIRTYAK